MHTKLSFVNFRLVLVSTSMMDSYYCYGVWKTLTILRAIFHVYSLHNFVTPFAFFSHHDCFTSNHCKLPTPSPCNNLISCSFFCFINSCFNIFMNTTLHHLLGFHHPSLKSFYQTSCPWHLKT
jgi:hypothetical protein